MKCVFINLEVATRRRQLLEASFQSHASKHWTVERWPAVTAPEAARRNTLGKISGNEKGCYLSHVDIIRAHQTSDSAYMVLEDDAVFGASTCRAVDGYLAQKDSGQWDLLFTDVCIPNPGTMVELIRLRRQLAAERSIRLLDLKVTPFAAAAAYVVMPGASKKLLDVLGSAQTLDQPYDMALRRAIYQGKLKAACFFPFLTTLSNESEASQIQAPESISADLVWNTFRKMVWMDRDLASVGPALDTVQSQLLDEDAKLFAPLLAAQASTRFARK